MVWSGSHALSLWIVTYCLHPENRWFCVHLEFKYIFVKNKYILDRRQMCSNIPSAAQTAIKSRKRFSGCGSSSSRSLSELSEWLKNRPHLRSVPRFKYPVLDSKGIHSKILVHRSRCLSQSTTYYEKLCHTRKLKHKYVSMRRRNVLNNDVTWKLKSKKTSGRINFAAFVLVTTLNEPVHYFVMIGAVVSKIMIGWDFLAYLYFYTGSFVLNWNGKVVR